MNKINIEMKYAGHNRYGMIIRFFMFYCLLTLIIYSDQRTKYVINEGEDKYKINDGKVQLELKNYNILVNNGNKIKNDFIELLNIITVNNYDIILNKISEIILNNNIVTIDNILNLYLNQNIFIKILLF